MYRMCLGGFDKDIKRRRARTRTDFHERSRHGASILGVWRSSQAGPLIDETSEGHCQFLYTPTPRIRPYLCEVPWRQIFKGIREWPNPARQFPLPRWPVRNTTLWKSQKLLSHSVHRVSWVTVRYELYLPFLTKKRKKRLGVWLAVKAFCDPKVYDSIIKTKQNNCLAIFGHELKNVIVSTDESRATFCFCP